MIDSSDVTAMCQELMRAGKLIPFLGSGMSARFNFPTWDGLIELIANDLNWDPRVFELSGNYLQLAEYYVITKGSVGPLRSKLDKLFVAPDDKILASKAHQKLVQLNFPLIYTTNFEDVIERAFQLFGPEYGKRYKVISNIDDFQEATSDVVQIVKFHGTFADDDSLVLTETNYFDRLEFESALDIKLRADMLGKSLLFIGYSFSDLNLRFMLYKLNKLRRQHKLAAKLPTAIMTSFGSTPIERQLLSRWDVLIAELDPVERDESVDRFLEELG